MIVPEKQYQKGWPLKPTWQPYMYKHSKPRHVSPTNNISNTNTNKWVINISSKPLTQAQEKLLAHGPNYTVVPRSPPITEYIAVVEQACSKLQRGEVEELRGEVKSIIKRSCNPLITSPGKKGRP